MSTFKALIAGALILSSVTASAAPLSCSLAFNPEARRWYAADSIDLLKQIAKNGNLDVQDDMAFVTKTLMLKLGLQMRPEVLRVSGDFEGVVRTFDNAMRTENTVSDLMHLKFGLPKNESAIRWAERAVLEKGLVEFMNQAGTQPIHDKNFLDNVRIKIAKLLDQPVLDRIQAAVRDKAPLLSDLPDRDIPTNLMAKIIRDGIPAHEQEIQTLYRASGQQRADTMRAVQRAAGVAAVIVVAYILFQKYEDFDITHTVQKGGTVVAGTSQTVTVQEPDPAILKILDQANADMSKAPEPQK